jgi:hypothetical protein
MQTINKILLAVLCLLGVALRAAQEEPVYVAMYSEEDLRVYPGNKNFRTLSSGEQAEVIRRLRVQLEDSDPDIRFQSAGSLLKLRDEAGIEYMVGLYHQPWDPEKFRYRVGDVHLQLLAEDALESAAHAGVEAILPFLIDDVTRASREVRLKGEPVPSDMPNFRSIQSTSTVMAARSIMRSRAYPPATVAWATKIYDVVLNKEPTQAEAQLISWWEHNKAAILAKDYAKATWLPPAVGGETPPATPNAPTNPASVTPTPLPPASPDSASPLTWLALAAATLAALALGWRLVRRR